MSDFWAGRRVLVTGGTGFLGQHLVEQLQAADCSVTATGREHDLTEAGTAELLLATDRPHVVFHLAARVGGIGENRLYPGSFCYQNLTMGCNLIEAWAHSRAQKLVMVGTVCSYPENTPVPFRESDLWNGYPEPTNAPYGIAKRTLMELLRAYRQQYGFRSACPILANLYGPGDSFDPDTGHVIPALIRQCVEAQENHRPFVTVWGTGKPTRDFLHVRDAARALVLAAERMDDAEPVNVGTGLETSIEDLARLIADVVGYKGTLVFDPSKPDGQPRRCLDVGRARDRLGFTAEVGLEEGLRETVAWWRANRN